MKFTIVIPSYNERDNVESLVKRIELAVGQLDVSVIYVDDSTDGTEDGVAAMAKSVKSKNRASATSRCCCAP